MASSKETPTTRGRFKLEVGHLMAGLNAHEVDEHLTRHAKKAGLNLRLWSFTRTRMELACHWNPRTRRVQLQVDPDSDSETNSDATSSDGQPERECPAGITATKGANGVWKVESISVDHQHTLDLLRVDDESDDEEPPSVTTVPRKRHVHTSPSDTLRTPPYTPKRPRAPSEDIVTPAKVARPAPRPAQASKPAARSYVKVTPKRAPGKPWTVKEEDQLVSAAGAAAPIMRPAGGRAAIAALASPFRPPVASTSRAQPAPQPAARPFAPILIGSPDPTPPRTPAAPRAAPPNQKDLVEHTLDLLVEEARQTGALIPPKYLPSLNLEELDARIILSAALKGPEAIQKMIAEVMDMDYEFENGHRRRGLTKGTKIKLEQYLTERWEDFQRASASGS